MDILYDREFISEAFKKNLCLKLAIALPFDIKNHSDFIREEHVMIVSSNKEALAKLRAFWGEIRFGFQVISDTGLVLLKVRK